MAKQAASERENMASYIESIPVYPAGEFSGRGIVIVAGGQYLVDAFTTIAAIRGYGSKLRIQVRLAARRRCAVPRMQPAHVSQHACVRAPCAVRRASCVCVVALPFMARAAVACRRADALRWSVAAPITGSLSGVCPLPAHTCRRCWRHSQADDSDVALVGCQRSAHVALCTDLAPRRGRTPPRHCGSL